MISLDPSRPFPASYSAPRAVASKPPAVASENVASPCESAQISSLPARIAALVPSAVAKVAQSMEGMEFVPGELIVKLQEGMETGLMGDFASEYGAEVVEHFDLPESVFNSFGGELVRLKLPQGIEVAEAIAAMQQDGRVVYAEGNEIIRLPETEEHTTEDAPNDLDSKLWGLNNTGQDGGEPGLEISTLEAWKQTTGDNNANGPLLAVVGTGVDDSQTDLMANIWGFSQWNA